MLVVCPGIIRPAPLSGLACIATGGGGGGATTDAEKARRNAIGESDRMTLLFRKRA